MSDYFISLEMHLRDYAEGEYEFGGKRGRRAAVECMDGLYAIQDENNQ